MASETAIVVEPRKPKHELLDMPRLDWSPPGSGGGKGGRLV